MEQKAFKEGNCRKFNQKLWQMGSSMSQMIPIHGNT